MGTLVGGVGAPLLFGVLIASGSRFHVGGGYLLGGLLMLAGAVCEYFIGVEAAGKSPRVGLSSAAKQNVASRCAGVHCRFPVEADRRIRQPAGSAQPARLLQR